MKQLKISKEYKNNKEAWNKLTKEQKEHQLEYDAMPDFADGLWGLVL